MRSRPRPYTDRLLRLRREHTPIAIAERLSKGPHPNYLRDWVYGGIDGAVTTFAILAGVAGASLSPRIMLIVGFANLLADGFALAAGDFVATRTENDNYRRLRKEEGDQIRDIPEGEREEIRQIFSAKGFEGQDLERVVDVITSDRARWIDTMVAEEYGVTGEYRDPWLAAMSTFLAFGICGFVPLVPFILGWPISLVASTILTVWIFFFIGALKSLWSTSGWIRSGVETLVIGMSAAGIAFVIGFLLRIVLPG